MEENRTEVKIFGNVYVIRAEDSPEYIHKVARYVDKKMNEIKVNHPTPISVGKIAILAALNIADEYFKLKKKYEEKIKELIKKLEKE